MKFSMNAGVKSIALMLSAVFLFSGCTSAGEVSSGKVKGWEETPSSSESGSEAPKIDIQGTADAAKEQALQEQQIAKYNAYVDLNNFMHDRLNTVISGYFRRVVYQEEFQMQDGETDFWCNSLSDYDMGYLDEADKYVDAKPEMEDLDGIFRELTVVMRPMMETFIEIYNYGELKTYKDDNYAGAAELHEKLWPLYTSFEELEVAFYEAVDVMCKEQEAKDLELFKEYGYIAHYTYSSLITKGQEIQDAIYMQGVSDENILELDVEALQPLYEELVELVNDSLEITEDQVKEEGGYLSPMFNSTVKDVKVSLTNLFERVKDQRPLQSYELNSAFPSSGTISEFEEKMGDLVDEYNSTWN